MNIREFDNMARRAAFIKADCRCEICGGSDCGNEVLEDCHIITRGCLLTRWAKWNHIIAGNMHHKKNWELRKWVETNRPDIWRKVRHCEARREQRRYHERNMNPARVRARLMRSRILKIQRFGLSTSVVNCESGEL